MMAKIGNMLSVGIFTDEEMDEINKACDDSGKSWNEFIMGLVRNE